MAKAWRSAPGKACWRAKLGALLEREDLISNFFVV